jgi:ribosomal protein S18 acetylase RimI-like enzyme
MLLIRRYQASDQEAIWDLHVLGLHVVGVYITNSPWDQDLQAIERIYVQSGGEFLVGLYEERIVAMGALRRTSETHAEVKRMRVHPDFQRRGFGRSMLKALEARAMDLGYTTLHLETWAKRTSARKLYLDYGFQETGQKLTLGLDCILYEKAIGARDMDRFSAEAGG